MEKYIDSRTQFLSEREHRDQLKGMMWFAGGLGLVLGIFLGMIIGYVLLVSGITGTCFG